MAQPRLLLFGPPGAGKSSLLGALAQAASIEAPALPGALVDKSGSFTKLQKKTYEGKLAATKHLEEYDVRFDGADTDATLLDCSGKDADAMLKAEQPFDADHPMRRPILDADAVLLIVDASQPGKQLNEEFKQFGKWLNHLHETRGRRVDVGDLPVYLVLTKCDSLAQKDDTLAMWMQRIEEGKRKIYDKFQAYIKDQGSGFGSLDVKLWATSIKRPVLTDRQAKGAEPYGVAELFRESMDAAADFQHRRYTSQRRLQNVTVGLLGTLAMAFFGLVFLVGYQPDKTGASLDEKVQRTLPKSDVPAVRLGGTLKKLEEKQQVLTEIVKDPAFARLPTESQKAVETYRKEIDQYLRLDEERKSKVSFPFVAKDEADFTAQETSVKTFTYPREWDDTALGKHVRLARAQYERVREKLKEEEAWLIAQTDAMSKLLDDGTDLHPKLLKAQREVRKLQPKLHQGIKLSDKEEKVLQDAKQLSDSAEVYENNCRARFYPKRVPRIEQIQGVTGVTYEFLEKFQAIKAADKAWRAEKAKVERVLRNVQEEAKNIQEELRPSL